MSFRRVAAVLIAALSLIGCEAQGSYPNLAGTAWEGAHVPPGTQLIKSKDPSGAPVNTLKFSGGVTMTQAAGGVVGIDNSGHGAVLCSWEVYFTMKNFVKACDMKVDQKFMDQLDYAVNRYNDFIVANSLQPVTKAQLEARILRDFEKLKDELRQLPKDKMQQECTAGSTEKMIRTLEAKMKSMSEQEMNDNLEKSLVPRPPVMNPCF